MYPQGRIVGNLGEACVTYDTKDARTRRASQGQCQKILHRSPAATETQAGQAEAEREQGGGFLDPQGRRPQTVLGAEADPDASDI